MKTRNKFKLGRTSNSRLNTTSEYLQLCVRRALLCSPVDFGIPWRGGLRTEKQQNEIYRNGNSKCDGYTKKSNHQVKDAKGKSNAVDAVPYIVGIGFDYSAYARFGIMGMLMLEAWQELQDEGLIPKHLFLHWGGLWSHKDKSAIGWDSAHYEIKDYPQKELL